MDESQRCNLTRRRLIRGGAFGLPLLSLGLTSVFRSAAAKELPRLKESNPAAKALGYRHDAGAVTSGARQSGAVCANCQLYTGDRNGQWGTCTAFPGKLVNAAGWCSAWVKAG
ncbi:MAG: high-potential iron-sulfur protein [Ectothiorhodospiraceae bacterium]